MVEELGGSDCLDSDEEDCGAVFIGERCTTFNGMGVVTFSVFLCVFLDEELVLGVFMMGKEGEEEDELKKMNESDGLRMSKVSKVM